MARTFRRTRQTAPISEMNVTNLVDLGFTLLIIFMIATPLINKEQTKAVDLPVESQSERPPPDPDLKFEIVTLLPGSQVQVAGQTMPIAALESFMARYRGQANPPVFRLRMSATTNAQDIVSVMRAIEDNGLSKISFDTQVKTGG